DQIMSRRYLKDVLVKRLGWLIPDVRCVKKSILVPGGRHARGKQRLYFRCKIQDVVVDGVEQRLDSKPVTRSKKRLIGLIPENKSKLATQMFETMRSQFFV